MLKMKKQWIYTSLIFSIMTVPAFLMLNSNEQVELSNPLEIILFNGEIKDIAGILTQPPDPTGGQTGDDPGDALIDNKGANP
ncbi:MAG: hypothetical protein ACFFBD_15660 [Candidatus Hodarchaeota archaeon]